MRKVRKLIVSVLLAALLTAAPASLQYLPVVYAEAAQEAAQVTLNKSSITIYIDDTYTLILNGTTQSVKWSSSNSDIATVSQKGVVTGVKKGTATITAKAGPQKYNCKVTIKAPSISSKTLSMTIGSQEKLSVRGAKGTVIWSSSNKNVASVNSKGIVTAKAEGISKITAKVNGISLSCYVTVNKLLHANKTRITISEEAEIIITVEDMQEDEIIDFEIEDIDIISCELGEWRNNRIPLIIKPLNPGTSSLTVTTDYKDEELVIDITVKDDLGPELGQVQQASGKLSAGEVYAQCSPSVVQINTDIAIGSGFFIGEYKIVTNYHVIKGARSIEVQMKDGTIYKADSILGYDIDLDIAVLSVPVQGKPLLLNRHGINIGDAVYAIGSSMGLEDTFTDGIVTNSSRSFDGVDYIQTNAAITNGNSGGPLLNAYGEVIGINTMQYVKGQNLNFAINISQLEKVNLNNPVSLMKFYGLGVFTSR